MTKQKLSAQLLLGPVPAALISCGNNKGVRNIITLAWVGVVNSSPPMVAIAVRPHRYSYSIIRDTREFVVNIPTAEQADLVDGCGTVSGKQVQKFEHFGVTPVMGTLKHAPMIDECPISLECCLEHTLELDSHVLFIGRVVQVFVNPAVLDEQGKVDFRRCRLLGFCAGRYLAAEPLDLAIGFTLKEKP